ncbi:hypothetical protein [Kitasatospora cinereorecta]|uniref:Amidohydrolase 3 domain-containing protein n=1 Tax=Kitasatospora cinereorecta TaxID=285560 RepID=A0ABW0V7J1_9ACTN
MLTLHRATTVVPGPTAPPITDGAVLVDGAVVAAIGPYAPVPGVRVREWSGLLVPGLRNPWGRWLLETAYHPDPREELGAEPLLVEVTEDRRGPSARRGLQRMLAHGTTAVAGPPQHPAVRTAVARSGLTPLPGDGLAPLPGDTARGGLDPLAGVPFADAVHRPLAVGGPADFAVFDAASVEELERRGAGCCLATVLGGRLLHRRR